ncbi:MAG: hypothetical protein PHN45_05020 [Methylococcales bacterium]|nr:hypothetical protein [Methylococcales bacterium]
MDTTVIESFAVDNVKRTGLGHFLWYKLLPHMKTTFLFDWKNNERIENYSKIFSYFILFVALGVGTFMSLYTRSYVPLVVTAFIGIVSFVVGDYFDSEKKYVFLKRGCTLENK